MGPYTNSAPVRNTKTYILAGVAVLLVGGALLATFLAWRIANSSNKNAHNGKQQAIIQITGSGFTPETLTVKPGTTIVWRNLDSAAHAVASNPYPQDSSLPGLHSKSIAPSGMYTFTPSGSSTIQYHDELQPTHNGTITVKE